MKSTQSVQKLWTEKNRNFFGIRKEKTKQKKNVSMSFNQGQIDRKRFRFLIGLNIANWSLKTLNPSYKQWFFSSSFLCSVFASDTNFLWTYDGELIVHLYFFLHLIVINEAKFHTRFNYKNDQTFERINWFFILISSIFFFHQDQLAWTHLSAFCSQSQQSPIDIYSEFCERDPRLKLELQNFHYPYSKGVYYWRNDGHTCKLIVVCLLIKSECVPIRQK